MRRAASRSRREGLLARDVLSGAGARRSQAHGRRSVLQMSTRSTTTAAQTAAQSVDACCHPHRPLNASLDAASRPTTVCCRGSTGRSKNSGRRRHAFEWARNEAHPIRRLGGGDVFGHGLAVSVGGRARVRFERVGFGGSGSSRGPFFTISDTMPDRRGRAGAMDTKEVAASRSARDRALPWALPFIKALAVDLLRALEEGREHSGRSALQESSAPICAI